MCVVVCTCVFAGRGRAISSVAPAQFSNLYIQYRKRLADNRLTDHKNANPHAPLKPETRDLLAKLVRATGDAEFYEYARAVFADKVSCLKARRVPMFAKAAAPVAPAAMDGL